MKNTEPKGCAPEPAVLPVVNTSYVEWRTAEGIPVVNAFEAKRLSDDLRNSLGELNILRECETHRKELVAQLQAANEARDRLTDLVRYSRGELFHDGLITHEEYAALVADSEGGKRVARLEGYDAMKQRAERAEFDVTRRKKHQKNKRKL